MKLSGLYNVRQTSSNFLLNKEGQIIIKNIYWEELIQRTSTILKFSEQYKND